MDLQSLDIFMCCMIYCMSVNMLDFVPCCHFLPQVYVNEYVLLHQPWTLCKD